MSESWDTQKKYIDASASCEAYKVGGFVMTMVVGMSIVYAVIVFSTASEISSLQKRATAAEKAIESLQEGMAK